MSAGGNMFARHNMNQQIGHGNLPMNPKQHPTPHLPNHVNNTNVQHRAVGGNPAGSFQGRESTAPHQPKVPTQMQKQQQQHRQQQQQQSVQPKNLPPRGVVPGMNRAPPIPQATMDMHPQQTSASHPPSSQQQAVGGQQPEFDHAISYVTTIKRRFSNEPRTYQQFLEILHTYQKEQRGIREVLEQVSSLFADHPDLLKEFTYFLPEAVQEQAKERLHAAAAEAEARLFAAKQKTSVAPKRFDPMQALFPKHQTDAQSKQIIDMTEKVSELNFVNLMMSYVQLL